MKRKIMLILSVLMIFSICITVNAKIERRRPYNNYYSEQNPPDFSWVHTNGATYSVIVASDKELKNIKYRADNLTKNLYNFTEKFEPGEYYWTYEVNGVRNSEVYRFYIPENATEYVVPFSYDSNEDMEKVIREKLSNKHPRLLVNDEILADLKENPRGFISLRTEAETKISKGLPVLPSVIKDTAALLKMSTASRSNYFSNYAEMSDKPVKTALMYLVSGEEKYKEFAISSLEILTQTNTDGSYKWDPNKLFPFHSHTDMYESKFALDVATAYDWLYNELTETQKKNIIGLIEACIKRPYENFAKSGNINGSLYTQFVASHPYRLNECTAAALAIYEESQLARDLANFHLPVLINITSPFSYQDGIGSQGMFYGIQNSLEEVIAYINSTGIFDITSKALLRNTAYRNIYTLHPEQSYLFGDGYFPELAKDGYQYRIQLQDLAAYNKNDLMRGVNKWLLYQSTGNKEHYYNFTYSYISGTKAKNTELVKPDMLPLSKAFTDTGWAGINSSFYGDDKVSLRFKSSPYGSYNHSHPDQNSFVIYAYGENLTSDSDYYYSMGNDFDVQYNRQTWVHNAITYDNGIGQKSLSGYASGKITDFLHANDIDVVRGSAKDAYNMGENGQYEANIDRADRTIVYIKPNLFVVTDDLKSAGSEKSFEFWLNTQGTITTDESDASKATINKNDAYLFADVVYPQVTSKAYSFTEKPDGTFIDETVVKNNNITGTKPDNRIGFKTAKTAETKMVTLLSVNNENEVPCYYTCEEINGVIKIAINEESFLYINNSGKEQVTCDNITFKGEMAYISYETMAIINGTLLICDDIEYINSDVNVSTAVSLDKVYISSVENDAEVVVYTGDIYQIHKTENENEVKLKEGEQVYGIKYVNDGEYTTFNVYPSMYNLNLNSTLHEGYTNLEVSKSGNGTVIYDNTDRIIIGQSKTFRVVADNGYYVKSVKFNGDDVRINSKGEYTTPPVIDYSIFEVEFEPITDEEGPEISSYNKTFTYEPASDLLSGIVFGNINLKGTKCSEHGVLYSYENIDFKLSDVDNSTVRQFKSPSIDLNGDFGVEILDMSKNAPEVAYFRTYAKVNGVYIYGDIVEFERGSWATDASIKTFSYENGYIYPEFSPEVNNYVIGITDDNFDGFNFTLAQGATSEVKTVSKIGETAQITVTSYNGNKKTYNFTFANASESNSTGIAYTTGGTTVFASAPDTNQPEYYLYAYYYRASFENNRYTLFKYDITKVNPFSDKITLTLTSAMTEDEIAKYAENYKVAVYDTIYDPNSVGTITKLTYNNSLADGTYTAGEKICVVNVADREVLTSSSGSRAGIKLSADITDFIRRKLAEGKKEITILISGDESNDAWVKSSSGKEYNNLSFFNATELNYKKTTISWE